MTSAPDYIQPIIGYRAWGIGADGALFPFSGRAAEPWKVGLNEAACVPVLGGRRSAPHDHRAPGPGCTCGLYALGALYDRQLRLYPSRDKRTPPVVGAIAAWGEMEVHRSGFRAEYACVLALGAHPDMTNHQYLRATRAAARYGVPLLPFHELPREAARHGAPLTDLHHAAPFRRTPLRSIPSAATEPKRSGDGVTRTGYALDRHVWVAQQDAVCLVGVTEAAACRLPPVHGLRLPARGKELRQGETLATVTTGGGPLAITSPLSGVVSAVNGVLGQDQALLRREPEAAGWLVRLAPSQFADEERDIAWGAAGRRRYAAYADELGVDIAADLRPCPAPDRPPVASWADVKRALLATRRPRFKGADHFYGRIVRRLQERLLTDPVLAAELARLEVTAVFRLHDPETSLTLRLGGGRARLDYALDTGECDLVVSMSGDLAAEYFTGECDWVGAMGRGDLTIEGDTGRASDVAAAVSRLSHFARRSW